MPRSEPLLWLQLIGLGVLPLESLLLLLVLAGSDPGPLPGLERVLCWSIGALAPALLLARRPADVWSLLLLTTPLRGRREQQRRLSRLQVTPGLRVALAAGAALALPLLWWVDRHAAVATPLTPFDSVPRLVALLLAALLLAVMLWQWQQLIQSLWLLSRSPEAVAGAQPLSQAELEQQRLCLGLPLLLPDPLLPDPPQPEGPSQPQGPAQPLEPVQPVSPGTSTGDTTEGADQEADEAAEGSASAVAPVAVEPEQPAEESESTDLNQQIP
ncbi:low-complexity tail membrane protein [Synechococcus sp. CCY 9618]|uniref:low-complexity tail membrane protein n=1 Tax=Synechococcus sp. CCY 9618 TaxID=2815602 RepID=UPI0020B28CB2|nr:low-complexity tail membrane protein [Synechococcus sp. CCY 9618]